MAEELKGQIAFVTGASRGIGRAIARRLGQAGCGFALAARSKDELTELAEELESLGVQALALKVDLRQDKQIRNGIEQALDSFGRIDILINNAGLWRYGLVQNLSLEDWDEMFDVNLRGLFLCTKYALPTMLKRRHGHIVNIGSVSGLIGEREGAGYCATKWGVRGFSQSLYKELGPKGVRVTLVEPGVVNNNEGKGGQDKKEIQVEDIADVVFTALTLPERSTLYEAVVWPTDEEYP